MTQKPKKNMKKKKKNIFPQKLKFKKQKNQKEMKNKCQNNTIKIQE